MTTTRERREEYHNVVRTLSPSRPLSPGTHTAEFDSNLDNLLEDLQASVSRPGSSLGQPIGGGGGTYSSTREVQYLQPANVTTVARERSLSPNLQTQQQQSSKVYKTAKYEYKSSSSGGVPSAGTEGVSEVYQRNINQLDTLLNDLERERDSSLDRSRSLSRTGIDSGLIEPGTKIIKTTTTYSSAGGNKQPVSRELVFDSPGSYEIRQSRSRQRSPSYENASTTTVKNVSYSTDSTSNGNIYGGINRSRTVTPVRSEQYYTETRTVSPNSELVPRNVHYNKTVSVDTAPASRALANIPLSDDILPRPNTKVTTTVRTYTYELPPDSELNQTLSYRNESLHQTSNTLPIAYPERDLSPTQHVNPSSKTILVKNETINTSNNVQEYPVQTILDHNLPPNTAKSIYYKKDTKHSTTHYYPEHPTHPHPGTNFQAIEAPPGDHSPYPPGSNTYIYREERTSNNTNNRYGSPVPIIDYPDSRHGTYPREPHQQQQQMPPPPTTVTYKYSSTTTNATRNVYPPPEEREPLLQPFPTDGIPQNEVDGSPPKRVEDLMATLGENGQITYMSKHTTHNTSSHHQNGSAGPRKPREPSPPAKLVEEPLDSSQVVPVASSKNVAGPPVYYPPGHEMFAKKESEAAAWRAQGEYAKASGKYMYEAESKSKTTSKSGAAVVPVCLPLCCAMPCTIM